MPDPHDLRSRGGGTIERDAGADDVLSYLDQGSFLGLRALGRGPALHLTWLYSNVPDEAAVRQFSERLARGFLGRLVQRSPLPWGRHRWVANPVPGPITWFRDPIPGACLSRLRHRLLDLPVDPEHGPGWRLAVQMLEDGGCALTMLVSHTIADLQATSQAIADAVADRSADHQFPTASGRWSAAMLARDSVESLRALPDIGRSLGALVRRLRTGTVHVSRPGPRAPRSGGKVQSAVNVPVVQVILETDAREERESVPDLARSAMIMAFAARVALRIGRVDAAGRVKLVLPVSDRRAGDRRGNALRPIALTVDPDACHGDLRALQRELRDALVSLFRNGDELSPLLPLIPCVPLRLARHLERMAIGSDLPVGCSMVGELPPGIDRPCGEAQLLQACLLERYAAGELERLGGLLFVFSYRVDRRAYVTVSGYAPGCATTRTELMPFIRDALADVGLRGTLY